MTTALALLLLAAQAREEAVEVPKAGFSVPIVHVPVDGTPLRPFALGTREVTWAEFNVFYAEHEDKRIVDGTTRPSIGKSYFGQVQCPEEMLEARKPAINLRWHAAMAYCDWLTAVAGRKFRLPTEAEWEHAARGGGAAGDLDAQAWHAGNSGGTTRVPGTSTPNAWGLHDMLGNVWEVCLEPIEPPSHGPVYRGGAWNTPKASLAPGLRTRVPPEWFAADPSGLRSVWWLTSEFCQGMRVACVGDAEALKQSAALAPAVRVALLKQEERVVPLVLTPRQRKNMGSTTADQYLRVSGEVVNGTSRAIDELELQVFYVTPGGKPHFVEKDGQKPGRPNYSWVHPVLATGPDGPSKKPLAPGEARRFTVDVPLSFDPENVKEGAMGARVTWVRPAP